MDKPNILVEKTMEKVSDSYLLEQLRAGDQKAFDLLFVKYYKLLLASAYSLLLDENEAKDIVQNFFVDLWERKIYLDLQGSAKGYFFKSIHNRCINNHSKTTLNKKRPTQLVEVIVKNEDENGFSEQLHINLESAMAVLPAQKREALKLVYMQDKKYVDAAQAMGISVNSLKTHLKSGLKILRKKLKGN
ncbi:sigma-70 family RNA polymerase sigma factor [Spirosoma aureum]|uniref:Sigma-70 family RNA polymerase sigma factor n=1 Tax=Spirosoma aureum TaxID=2692134 RepID=A0A6G9ARG8_9BACT|nr:sigma-70 family RNA polymerase sigma factor [Spirosoma aureum]QIP15071.1 sigma-70 family RNA polymerase sigma factor [Spirosoma aureum]